MGSLNEPATPMRTTARLAAAAPQVSRRSEQQRAHAGRNKRQASGQCQGPFRDRVT